jgi:hypothetical protein
VSAVAPVWHRRRWPREFVFVSVIVFVTCGWVIAHECFLTAGSGCLIIIMTGNLAHCSLRFCSRVPSWFFCDFFLIIIFYTVYAKCVNALFLPCKPNVPTGMNKATLNLEHWTLNLEHLMSLPDCGVMFLVHMLKQRDGGIRLILWLIERAGHTYTYTVLNSSSHQRNCPWCHSAAQLFESLHAVLLFFTHSQMCCLTTL